MVIKVYISGISGNKEVKKRQQRVLLILDSKNIKYEVIDIAEPGNEDKKDFMQSNSTSSGGTISDPTPRHPLPPQIYNDDDYCGDYDQFDMSNEVDEMEKFLKIAPSEANITSNAEIKLGNGEITTDKNTAENDTKEDEEPEEKAKEEIVETKEEIIESKEEIVETKTDNDNEEEENQENVDEE